MRNTGFIYQSGFWFCFCFYLIWYLVVGCPMKLHNCSSWGLYFVVITEGEKVLIFFHSLIIYLTSQHNYSLNCEFYKKHSYNMSCCEFITENLLTITGITSNQTLTLTIQADSRWTLSNYKAWCSLLIKRYISSSFFLLYVQCEGPCPTEMTQELQRCRKQSPFLISQAVSSDLKINGAEFKVHDDPDSYLG